MTLVVVSGAPGTGKSTIARELGFGLQFCVLSLDPIKEALADVLGLGDEHWSNRVGDAAAEVVPVGFGLPRHDCRRLVAGAALAGRPAMLAGWRGAYSPRAPGYRCG